MSRKGNKQVEGERRAFNSEEASEGEVSHLKTETGSPEQKGKGTGGKARLDRRAASWEATPTTLVFIDKDMESH